MNLELQNKACRLQRQMDAAHAALFARAIPNAFSGKYDPLALMQIEQYCEDHKLDEVSAFLLEVFIPTIGIGLAKLFSTPNDLA